MIRFAVPIICFLTPAITTGCTATGAKSPAPNITSVAVDEVEGVSPAQEFARLCLAENSSTKQIADFAISNGWQNAQDVDLTKANLSNLRRQILEIPGGGGNYRETQFLLHNQSVVELLIANLMERFDRKNKIVRTECTIYTLDKNHLSICAAIGNLLKRAPDSNQRYKQTGSQFIRWNIAISNRPASVRCEGIATNAPAEEKRDETNVPKKASFMGTVVSMIVDHSSIAKSKKTKMDNSTRQDR